VSRSQPEPDAAADVDALRRELRRLRAEVSGLQEEKQDLERRLASMARELELTRAKVPRGISTS
jgi:predicted  nucleic acid-binding Zn-ribbon protein